jgi:hypothetical protein
MTESEMELAMVLRPDGTPVPRTAALESFRRFQDALAKAGGRAPRHNGVPMLWSESRGWFPRETRST